ncbi:MAG: amino acid ABC transporter substrate-binding protein [Bradymonadaceae bacterium]|nr:amino acid ABC transporter substrate-binding protein [Lujinxingiaceae bacterium]
MFKSQGTFKHLTVPAQATPSVLRSEPTVGLQIVDTLIVGFNPNWAPYSMLTAENRIAGFEIEIVEQVAKRVGLQVRFEPALFARTIADLKVGRIHVSTGVSKTPDRQKIFQFARSYGRFDRVVFVNADRDDIGGSDARQVIESLQGKKLGVLAFGVELEVMRTLGIELVETSNLKRCLELLLMRQLDACSTVREVGDYFTKEHGLAVKKIDVVLTSHPYATAFSPMVSAEFIERYNAAREELEAEGAIDQLRARWFGEEQEGR